ncbi:DUF4386 domain-containing protein [Paenibacillus harenae]|uniref:DUF4386 domain-containing protein n=1 Tax=Paenibacillus harenae TaxID=306543 RepID=UPI0004154255|nr:DUF4386 domain-containing protein [Paenibacillus harenae]
MVSSKQERSDQRKAALTGGISLILMVLAAFFSYGFIHGSLMAQGDAGTTFRNIQLSSMLFKAEIFGWVVILICDIAVAWAFYIFLKPIHRHLSLLGAWLRLIYSAILGIAIANLLFVMHLTDKRNDPSLFPTDYLQAQTLLHMDTFESIWSVGLIIFGGHLLIAGYVAFKSSSIPKLVSILLLIASVGYIAIHICSTFLPQYEGVVSVLEYVFMVPMFAGEFGFGLWLLFKGGKS